MTRSLSHLSCKAALAAALLLIVGPVAFGQDIAQAQSRATESGAIALPAHAGSVAGDPQIAAAIQRADELEAAGRFGEVVSVLQPWRERGNPEVDFRLAFAHFSSTMDGRSVESLGEMDLDEVVRLAERAASQGHGGAMNLLYMIHGNGFGRPTDMRAAMAWLERAVEAGDLGARINLASMLYEGRPWLARDRGRACRMFADFADLEGAGAMSLYYLGWATMHGECGLAKDPRKAAEWIGRAAEGNVRDAARDYARLLEAGVGVDADLAQARRWYEQASEWGDGYSLWRVGRMHAEGEGRVVDPVRAVDYFRRAIDAGNAEALVSMAVMHATGAGVEKDLPKALEFYRRAADAGQPHAYRGLAVMSLRGEGMSSDATLASVLYRQGLELGNAPEANLKEAIDAALDATARAEADRRFEAWRASRGQ